jgi:colanic acid/amylovoran biosynthesis protein
MRKSYVKFIILNQPTKNKGDFAAFKALINLIITKYPQASIECLFTGKDYDPLFDKVKNVTCRSVNLFGLWRITKICLKFPVLFKLLKFLPTYKEYSNRISNSDVAILAPGGLEIGAYQEWSVLWDLAMVNSLSVPFAIYSRSIGKFINKSDSDRLFIKYAIDYLQKSKFNGLREKKSQEFAGMLGIHHFPAIDVVYSYTPENPLDVKLTQGREDNYVVFVPSKFSNWHPDFTDELQEKMDRLYKLIISKVIAGGFDVVMLPHTYGRGNGNDDKDYFKTLIEDKYRANCIIVDDTADTDDYQAIIKSAKFSVSARLHQVIFAINNHTPALCLSYEHKMSAMMEMLGLDDYSIDLKSVVLEHEKILPLLDEYINNASNHRNKFINAQNEAYKIAQGSFDNFIESIEKT